MGNPLTRTPVTVKIPENFPQQDRLPHSHENSTRCNTSLLNFNSNRWGTMWGFAFQMGYQCSVEGFPSVITQKLPVPCLLQKTTELLPTQRPPTLKRQNFQHRNSGCNQPTLNEGEKIVASYRQFFS